MGVEVVHGDLKDASTIADACRGVERVVSTANSMMSRRKGDSFETVDRDGHLALIASAERAGVEHFVYISVSPNVPDCAFFRCKREVERALRDSEMASTVFQPAAFMETSFTEQTGWKFCKGTVRLMGLGLTPSSFISLCDVAEFVVEATMNSSMRGFIPLGGPEALTAMDAIKVFESARGTTLRVKRVPTTLLKAARFFLGPFSERASVVLSVVSNEQPDVIDMAPLTSEFPIKLTTLREFAERLERE
jgi:uncharacterized protein YbjT (DUF2867 family)